MQVYLHRSIWIIPQMFCMILVNLHSSLQQCFYKHCYFMLPFLLSHSMWVVLGTHQPKGGRYMWLVNCFTSNESIIFKECLLYARRIMLIKVMHPLVRCSGNECGRYLSNAFNV